MRDMGQLIETEGDGQQLQETMGNMKQHFNACIGANLSEPHIDEKYMRESYIYIARPSHERRLIQNLWAA